jgi:pilus assembly protein CpaE
VLLNGKGERRGALRVLLVAANEARRGEVRAALEALGDPPLEILEAMPNSANGSNGGPPADVEMVILDGEEDEPLAYLQSRAAYIPRPALFAILQDRAPNLMRRVLRAGADEVLFLPLDHSEATSALLKISETRRRTERDGRGEVCSLVSLVGGSGVTTLSANLALALRHMMDKRVAAVDLDLQEGGLGVFLNLEPEHTIANLADPQKKLDSIQLELALTKHPSGIYLLAAPRRIEDSELISDSVIAQLLDLMRQLFDYVVVDCGSHISETAVSAWEHSDHLLYVVDQSLGSVRCAWRFIDLFARLKLPVEPQFVINRYTQHHPITDEQICHTLARPVFARVPRDDKNLERVQWGAHDLWQVAPRSTLIQGFEELANSIVGGSASPSVPRGKLVSRLLATIGRN